MMTRLQLASMALMALTVLEPAHLAAQRPDSAGATARRWRLDGDMGSEGELYRMSGRDPRRPGETGEIFFKVEYALNYEDTGASATVAGPDEVDNDELMVELLLQF